MNSSSRKLPPPLHFTPLEISFVVMTEEQARALVKWAGNELNYAAELREVVMREMAAHINPDIIKTWAK